MLILLTPLVLQIRSQPAIGVEVVVSMDVVDAVEQDCQEEIYDPRLLSDV